MYGRAGEKDVLLASQIARREGFSLDVIDKDYRPIIPPDQFAETARLNFLAADSYQYTGIFQNGAEIAESAWRVCGNTIAFNGGGGEIFRNFFYLLDGKYTIRELLWSFYSQFDPAVCTPIFYNTRYYNALENKVMDLLASDERRLPRPTVEWLYHSFRCRAGRQSRQRGRPLRVHGHAVSGTVDNRARKRASAVVEKSRRLRGRVDTPS